MPHGRWQEEALPASAKLLGDDCLEFHTGEQAGVWFLVLVGSLAAVARLRPRRQGDNICVFQLRSFVGTAAWHALTRETVDV